jgi:hypothetical protein
MNKNPPPVLSRNNKHRLILSVRPNATWTQSRGLFDADDPRIKVELWSQTQTQTLPKQTWCGPPPSSSSRSALLNKKPLSKPLVLPQQHFDRCLSCSIRKRKTLHHVQRKDCGYMRKLSKIEDRGYVRRDKDLVCVFARYIPLHGTYRLTLCVFAQYTDRYTKPRD